MRNLQKTEGTRVCRLQLLRAGWGRRAVPTCKSASRKWQSDHFLGSLGSVVWSWGLTVVGKAGVGALLSGWRQLEGSGGEAKGLA